MFQLADFFSTFDFHFAHAQTSSRNFWSGSLPQPGREAWEELAFEGLCLAHEELIEKALGIDVLTFC